MYFKYIAILFIAFLSSFELYTQDGLMKGKAKEKMPTQNEAVDTGVVIYGWYLDDLLLTPEQSPIDTGLVGIQINNKVTRKYISVSHLGGNGSAYLPNYYFDREPYEGALFLKSYEGYFYTYKNTQYLNTRKPFTQLFYINAGGSNDKEEGIKVQHSQNVNEKLNLGFDLNVLSNKGQYKYLGISSKNFKAFSSYSGDRYSAHATYNLNRYTSEENGGINDSAYLSEELDPKAVETNFKGEDTDPFEAYASNKIRYYDAMFSQRLKLLTLGGNRGDSTKQRGTMAEPILSHVFYMQRTSKVYEENDIEKTNPDFPIYRHYFCNAENTYDSIAQFKVANRLQLDFKTNIKRKVTVGMYGSISHEYYKYSYFTEYDTLIYDMSDEKKASLDSTDFTFYKQSNGDTINEINKIEKLNNIFVDAGLYGKFWGRFESIFKGRIYLFGYKAGQTQLHGKLQTNTQIWNKPFTWSVAGNVDNIVPAYQLNSYYSNNYIWEQDLGDEQIVTLSSKLAAPSNKFEVSGKYALLRNHIYMTDSVPDNYGEVLNIFSIEAEKGFDIWNFHTYNKVIYQVSENRNIIEVPTVIFFNSTYFDYTWKFKLTGGELRTMLGVDIHYNTKFNGYSYIPASSMFYQSDDKTEIGNYPYVDLWLNAKLKSVRFFVKYRHFNSTGDRKDYYQAVSYPAFQRTLKIGLSWTFFN